MTELRKALERPRGRPGIRREPKKCCQGKDLYGETGRFLRSRRGAALRWSARPVRQSPHVAAGPSLWQYIQARQAPLPGWPRPWRGGVHQRGIEIQVHSAWPTTCGERSTSRSADVEGTGWTASSPCAAGGQRSGGPAGGVRSGEPHRPVCGRNVLLPAPDGEARWASATTGGAVPDTLHLAVERLTTRQGELDAGASCAGVTAALWTASPGEGDRVVMGGGERLSRLHPAGRAGGAGPRPDTMPLEAPAT